MRIFISLGLSKSTGLRIAAANRALRPAKLEKTNAPSSPALSDSNHTTSQAW